MSFSREKDMRVPSVRFVARETTGFPVAYTFEQPLDFTFINLPHARGVAIMDVVLGSLQGDYNKISGIASANTREIADKFCLQELKEPFVHMMINAGFFGSDGYIVDNTLPFTVAIENKLGNWEQALEQAIEYKSIVDMSFVALPASQAEKTDQSQFVKENVGLIYLEDKDYHVIHIPNQAETLTLDMAHMKFHLIKKLRYQNYKRWRTLASGD